MFELYYQQLKNILSTYRRMAKKDYRGLKAEEALEQDFQRLQETFTSDIQTGDVELVKKDFMAALKDFENLLKKVVDLEKNDALLLRKIGSSINEQMEPLEQFKRLVNNLKINKELISADGSLTPQAQEAIQRDISHGDLRTHVQKNIQGVDDLKNFLHRVMQEVTNQVKQMHADEMQELSETIKKIRQEHMQSMMDLQSTKQYLTQAFPEYDAKQAARYIRYNLKKLSHEGDAVQSDEKHVSKLLSKELDMDGLAKLFKAIEGLLKEESQEKDMFKKLLRAVTMELKYHVFKFFYYKRHLLQTLKQNEEQLKREGFPADKLDEIDKELDSFVEKNNQDLLSAERIFRAVYREHH